MLFGLCKCWSSLRGEQEDKMINVSVSHSIPHTQVFIPSGLAVSLPFAFKGPNRARQHILQTTAALIWEILNTSRKSYLFCCHGFNHKLLNVVDGDLNSRRVVIEVFFYELVSSLLFQHYHRSLFSLKLDNRCSSKSH